MLYNILSPLHKGNGNMFINDPFQVARSFMIDEMEETVPKSPILESESDNIQFIYHIAFDIVAMVIVAFGILSNLFNLIVLTRPTLKGVMYVYLIALAVSNLSALIISIPALLRIANPSTLAQNRTYATLFYFAHLEIPILNILITTSAYIIVCSTVYLFIAIYQPNCFRRFYTYKTAYLNVAISFLFGVIINAPFVGQKYIKEHCLDRNETKPREVHDGIHFPIFRTSLDEFQGCINKTYVVSTNTEYVNSLKGYAYVSRFFLQFGPIALILILTICIVLRFNAIIKERKANAIMHQDGSDRENNESGMYTPEEKRMVFLIISIAVTFLICNLPAAILSIIYITDPESFNKSHISAGYAIFRSISNNFELLGLCLNLAIYCFCSSDIRKTCIKTFFDNFILSSLCRFC